MSSISRKIKTVMRSAAVIVSSVGVAFSRPAHFNRLAEESQSRSDEVMQSLDIRAGDSVADLGAGGGYFTVKLARAVGVKGKVFAVDVNDECLAYIRQYAEKEKIGNVTCVKGTFEDSTLPAKSVDLVFVRNAYHDIGNRTVYFSRLRAALKKGGRVAIIDYLPGGFFRRLYGHYIRPERIVSEMNDAGYEVIRTFDLLEKQSFQIFKAR